MNGVYPHIHGSGFQFGSIAASGSASYARARRSGFASVSVDYRLAPVHCYAMQLEDCVAADWLLRSANPPLCIP